MDAVPCGAKETGLSGLGALWASAGVTHINSNEKLCPQYLLRTDEMDYEIRPLDLKHATLLPIGKEGEFKIKKNEMILTITAGSDQKARSYEVGVGWIRQIHKAAQPNRRVLQKATVEPSPRVTSG